MMVRGSSIWIVANTTWYVFNFRSRLIRELVQGGFVVTVLSPEDAYVAHVSALGVRHIPLEMDNAGTNPFRDAAFLARLLALFRKERPELLLTYTPKVNIYCSIAAKWIGVPVVANVSGLGTGFIRGGWLTALVKLLYRVALRHPRKVFFQNEEDRSLFVNGGLVTPDKTERLPGSGVDVRRFTPMAKVGGDRFVFLFVGRLLADKGIREYVEAARLVRSGSPDVEFRVLGLVDHGNPSAVSADEVRAWEAEGVIHHLGSVDDVVPHLAQADCVVLPSYREGCPRSLLEAASMAIPLIASNATGCRDVVQDGKNGFLCRLRDANDLAHQMRRMMALSTEDRSKMGLTGRELILKEFDENIVISRYLGTIREIFGK